MQLTRASDEIGSVPGDDSDETIVELLRRGLVEDPRVIALQRRLDRVVARYAWQLARPVGRAVVRADLDDIAGEWALHLFKNAPHESWRSTGGRLEHYLCKSYKNVAFYYFRGRKRDRDQTEGPMPIGQDGATRDFPSEAPDPEVSVWRGQLRQPMEECLAALPGIYQVVLRLRYFEEMSPAEIAQVLGISANLVSQRDNRGRERMRECLKGKGIL